MGQTSSRSASIGPARKYISESAFRRKMSLGIISPNTKMMGVIMSVARIAAWRRPLKSSVASAVAAYTITFVPMRVVIIVAAGRSSIAWSTAAPRHFACTRERSRSRLTE